MPIEKKLKSIKSTKTDYRNSMTFILNISNVTFLKIEKLIKEKRVALRLKVKPFNFITLLTFLPFALGFSQFLGQKYNNNCLTKSFFEQNLPTITKGSEFINFQTLNYIIDSNFSLLKTGFEKNKLFLNSFSNQRFLEFLLSENNKKNQINVNENVLFLNKNIFYSSLGQQKFSGFLKNQDFLADTSISSFDQKFFKIESFVPSTNLTFFHTLYRDLDELPGCLDNFFINYAPLKVEKAFLILDKVKFNRKPLKKNQHFFQSSLINNSNKFVNSRKKSKQNFFKSLAKNRFFAVHCLKTNILNEQTKQLFSSENCPNLALNTFQQFQNEYYSNCSLIQNELKKLFLEKKLSPSYPNSFSTKLKSNFILLENYDKFFLEKLITSLDKQLLCTDCLYFRKMSSYRYPDMRSSQIFCLLIQNKYFYRNQDQYFEIRLPSLAALKSKYTFSIKQLPSFLVYTKSQNLSDFEKGESFYQGPGIILDSIQGLDWKTKILKNDETIYQKFPNLRSWFQLYFSQSNPALKATQQFFGLYESPEYFETGIHLNQSNYWIYNSPVFNDRLLKSTELNFFPTQLYIQVPFLKRAEWQKMYFDLKIDIRDKLVMTPVIQTQVPTTKANSHKNKSNEFFEAKFSKVKDFLHFSSPLFEIGRLGKLDYQLSFFSFLTNSNKLLLNNLDSSIYSKALAKNEFFAAERNFNLFEITNYLTSSTDVLYLNQTFSPTLLGGRYQKVPSLFSKNFRSSFSFFDNWEYLTIQSWLIISQISFAFLIFRILKALADNYGRELLVYLLDLVAALGILDDDLKQEIEILMGQREKGFRMILQSRKTFSDVVGIEKLLPEISEIVWFLRNSARQFSISKTLPKGLLLTGPPGTGKTLLVQSLAGEAQVPVLVLSGSSLVEPGESSAVKIEILFQEARRLAPCIVFIDEIDTLAQKRSQVIQNPMGTDEILESLQPPIQNFDGFLDFKTSNSEKGNLKPAKSSKQGLAEDQDNQISYQQQSRQEQLSLLMQFLVELDGIQGRDGVIVIGATNRPEILDPAVLRPGRFDKIIELGLPSQQKRIEILKFYGQRLGYGSSISWDYFGFRTAGFTAADLSTIMNESSLNAILKQTHHTIHTIEYGIDRITTSETDNFSIPRSKSSRAKNSFFAARSSKYFNFKSNFSKPEYQFILVRLAYYQAGKIVLSFLLQYHPNVLIAYLWPRRSNIRSIQIAKNLQKYFFKIARRDELEQRALGCYAGKAAEILFLRSYKSQTKIPKNCCTDLSNLGVDDLSFGQTLSCLIIQKWYFYSKKSLLHKTLTIAENVHFQEFSREKIQFFQQLGGNFERLSGFSSETDLGFNAQNYFLTAWWQKEISLQVEFLERNFADWYRLYLPNPEETDLNPEWIPPDEFYHSNLMLKNISTKTSLLNPINQSKIVWNNFSTINRDYQVQSFVLQSFNLALLLVDENRELLDRMAIELLYSQILRESEISRLLKNFSLKKSPLKDYGYSLKEKNFKTNSLIKILDSSWGATSRKKLARWVDFTALKS